MHYGPEILISCMINDKKSSMESFVFPEYIWYKHIPITKYHSSIQKFLNSNFYRLIFYDRFLNIL